MVSLFDKENKLFFILISTPIKLKLSVGIFSTPFFERIILSILFLLN